MTARVPIPLLVDVVEMSFFPESTRLARVRRAHWRHCEFAIHYRERAARAGVFKAARQLRKQGITLHTALAVLAGRRSSPWLNQ